jgi:predicted Zn-dependent protease
VGVALPVTLMFSTIAQETAQSSQTTTLQDSSPQQPTIIPTLDASVGLGFVFLVVSGVVGWWLFHPRSSVRKPQSGTTALPSSLDANKTPQPSVSSAKFAQAIQWVAAGKALEKAEQYEEAIALYSDGLRHHPQDFRLWHEQGLAYAKLERFEMALACYDRAYALNPTQRDLAHERGDTLLQLERYEEAIAAFDVYLRYAPNIAHILADRGYALYKLQRYEEALQLLNTVLKTGKEDRNAVIHAHYYQIATLQQLGHLEAALQSGAQAIKSYSHDCFREQHEAIRQQIEQAR